MAVQINVHFYCCWIPSWYQKQESSGIQHTLKTSRSLGISQPLQCEAAIVELLTLYCVSQSKNLLLGYTHSIGSPPLGNLFLVDNQIKTPFDQYTDEFRAPVVQSQKPHLQYCTGNQASTSPTLQGFRDWSLLLNKKEQQPALFVFSFESSANENS